MDFYCFVTLVLCRKVSQCSIERCGARDVHCWVNITYYAVLSSQFLMASVTMLTDVCPNVLRVVWRCCFCTYYLLLGAFAVLRKATISFALSVCPSLCLTAWNNSTATGHIFIKFHIYVLFLKSVEKIQVSLESDKNNGYFTWRTI